MVTRSRQECGDCGSEFEELAPDPSCVRCGGLLALHHPAPPHIGPALRDLFDARSAAPGSGVWRYRELVLPGALATVSHPEGNTPLLQRDSIGAWCDVPSIRLKHEGHNPTGSFKDRGMTVGVTQALRIGAAAVACASTGNTSASLAAYAAQAGLPALVFVPAGKIATGKLAQTLLRGAHDGGRGRLRHLPPPGA